MANIEAGEQLRADIDAGRLGDNQPSLAAAPHETDVEIFPTEVAAVTVCDDTDSIGH